MHARLGGLARGIEAVPDELLVELRFGLLLRENLPSIAVEYLYPNDFGGQTIWFCNANLKLYALAVRLDLPDGGDVLHNLAERQADRRLEAVYSSLHDHYQNIIDGFRG